MINWKTALYEVLIGEMVHGKVLYQMCDRVFKSSIKSLKISNNRTPFDNFIVIGNYRSFDVPTGELRDKYRSVEQDVECFSMIKSNEINPEELAEERAEDMARIVRTIIKHNQKLTCSTFSAGIAVSSEFLGSNMEYAVYETTPVVCVSLILKMKVREDFNVVIS